MRAVTLVLAAALVAGTVAPALADGQPAPAAERLERWRQATPEQRLQLCKEAVARRQAMSPEEKEKLRAERHARWDALSPDKREAVKERMKARWAGLSEEERQEMKNNPEARCEIMAKHWQGGRGPGTGKSLQ